MEFEYEQFIKTIQHKAELSWEQAALAARVTLSTLAERLSTGEARDIAEQLPGQVGIWLEPKEEAERFDADEFLRRIAEREGVDLEAAERHARAVFTAIARAVSRQELDDMVSELPKDFEPLIAEARKAEDEAPREIVPFEEFITRVADRAGLDEDRARRASKAVLETLGERIAGGEVEDLRRELPSELGPPLQRGNERTAGKAEKMSLEEFVERVAEREGVRPSEAQEHGRAVFKTLRETVSEKEFGDMAAQLPDGYAPLLPSIAAPRR
jgi:uncharacterized protein (DUF2267 family)